MSESTFRAVVTPEHFIAVRSLPGGPAPQALAAALEIYTSQEARARALLEEGRTRRADAERLLATEAARHIDLAKAGA
jgi:argininosuccinate lyase